MKWYYTLSLSSCVSDNFSACFLSIDSCCSDSKEPFLYLCYEIVYDTPEFLL